MVALPSLDGMGVLTSFQVVRVRHLVPFVVALGVAVGAARAIALVRLRPTGRAMWATVGLGALVALLVGWQLAIAAAAAQDPAGARGAGIGWVAMVAALTAGLVALALAWLAARAARRRDGWSRLAALAVVALLLVAGSERLLYAHAERLTGGQLDSWQNRIALTSAQAAMLDVGGSAPGRTLTMGDEPNRMGFHGLEQVDGYVAAYPRAYHDGFRALIHACLDADPAIERYFEGWGQRFYAFCADVDPEVLDLLGVRWISARGMQPTLEGLVEHFRDGDLHLYENVDPFPRAFVVGGAEVVPDLDAAVARLGSADRATLAGTAIVVGGLAAADLPTTPGSAGTASIVRSEGDVVAVHASASRPAIMVMTDVIYPDWQVEVDGRAASIMAVDVFARGVAIGPGEHEIVFRYRPLLTWVGMGLAGAALVLTAVAALALARRDRRRP